MLRWMTGLLAGSGMAMAAAAQTAATPPAASQTVPVQRGAVDTSVFAQLPRVERPELSPNGKLFAARVALGGTQVFAIASVDDAPPVLIGLGDADLNWWRWVNDEWLVIGVGQLMPVEGDEWYVSRALGVNAKTGKAVRLGRDAA